jgi:hypothetical protein
MLFCFEIPQNNKTQNLETLWLQYFGIYRSEQKNVPTTFTKCNRKAPFSV